MKTKIQIQPKSHPITRALAALLCALCVSVLNLHATDATLSIANLRVASKRYANASLSLLRSSFSAGPALTIAGNGSASVLLDNASITNATLSDPVLTIAAEKNASANLTLANASSVYSRDEITVADQLFGTSNPIGQTLRIHNNPFKVLGVLKAKGFTAWGSDQDDLVVVPYTSAMKRISRRTYLTSILVQADTEENIPRIQNEVTELLNQRRRGREPDFTVRTQLELAEMATATAITLTAFLGIVAGVSLIVGGIGIMNIMLVSVTERTREIGIRLAIGAHDNDIRLQFLIEAMILSLMGGTLGILLGIGTSQLLSHIYHWTVVTSPFWIIISFLFSGGVGILFGFYPAHKAAKLDPIEALRFE